MKDSPRWDPGSREVHVWGVPIGDPPLPKDGLWTLLADEERERAARFRLEGDRARYLVTRGVLRLLLGRYTGRDPGSLHFAYGAHGKPALIDHVGPEGLRFNVSHSGDWSVVGVVRGREIGVDVERIRKISRLERIAEERFTPTESRALASLPPDRRVRGFFACWTRKEACLKALGTGLYHGLDRIALPPSAVVPPLRGVERSPQVVGPWSVWSLVPATGYLAAIAVEGRRRRLLPRTWSGMGGVRPWPGGGE